MSSVTVEVYSEKAIVVRNTLEHHGPIMEQLGGTFNEKLKGGRGWILPKYKMTQVRNMIDKMNSGQYGNEYEQKSSTPALSSQDMVSKAEYLSVLSRLERLEALVANMSRINLVADGNETPAIAFTPVKSSATETKTSPVIAPKPSIASDAFDFSDDKGEKKRLVSIKKPVKKIQEEEIPDDDEEVVVERKRMVSIARK